jgi:serine/threonine protein kinase
MVVMMVNVRGFEHSGYTKAVDWWSLGVTIYRLLSGKYPFKTDMPKPVTPEDIITEGSDRYSLLLEKVDYSWFASHSAVPAFISQLLVVDDKERLGYGPDGSTNVSAHPFFRGINWVELEQKKARPPPLPRSCVARASGISRDFGTLESMMRAYGMNNWVHRDAVKPHESTHPAAGLQDMFLGNWDYTSPSAVLTELDALR